MRVVRLSRATEGGRGRRRWRAITHQTLSRCCAIGARFAGYNRQSRYAHAEVKMLGISRQQTVRDNDFGRSVLHLKIMRRLTGIRTRGHPLLLHLSLLFHAHSFLVLARTNLSTRPTWRPEAFQSIADLLPNFPGRNARWNGRYGDCDGRLGDVGSPARMADPACMTKPKFLFCQHHQTAEGSPASLFFRPATSSRLPPPACVIRSSASCMAGTPPTSPAMASWSLPVGRS